MGALPGQITFKPQQENWGYGWVGNPCTSPCLVLYHVYTSPINVINSLRVLKTSYGFSEEIHDLRQFEYYYIYDYIQSLIDDQLPQNIKDIINISIINAVQG